MTIMLSKNRLKVRGFRRGRYSVVGGWQSGIAFYVPGFSGVLLYGKVSRFPYPPID